MSNRLNQNREKKLSPIRFNKAVSELKKRGFSVDHNETRIHFIFKGSPIFYFPYSGWASGKTIKDGRGLKSLLTQIDDGSVSEGVN